MPVGINQNASDSTARYCRASVRNPTAARTFPREVCRQAGGFFSKREPLGERKGETSPASSHAD